MKRAVFLGVLSAVVVLVLVAGVALANGTTISRYVIGGGGGHAEAAPYALDGTIGQPVTGVVSDSGYELCSGFWCGAAVRYFIYLPLVLRNG